MENPLNKIVPAKDSNLIVKGVFWVGGFFAAKYLIDRISKNSASDNAFEDENINLANQIYQAGHIWGGMAEDEERLIELAGYIKDYKKVSQAYRAKFGVNLDEELSRWLNASEYEQFKARLGTTVTNGTPSGGGSKPNSPTSPNIPTSPTSTTGFRIGQAVYFKESNWNVRSSSPPYKPIRLSKKGELAGYVANKSVVLTAQNPDGKTVKDNFVLLSAGGIGGMFSSNYYVSNSNLRA